MSVQKKYHRVFEMIKLKWRKIEVCIEPNCDLL
jgi:hypothetical protein